GVIHNMHRINKKKKFDQKEKLTTTNLNKIGHFYFGKNRTFLFWLDIFIEVLSNFRYSSI
ncbi:MAG: hypothetical protein ABIK53_00900, partial [bacterium]